MTTKTNATRTTYLVRGGGCPEQEILRELAPLNGRRARARQELVSEQEREPDQLAPHASPSSEMLFPVLPLSYEQPADA